MQARNQVLLQEFPMILSSIKRSDFKSFNCIYTGTFVSFIVHCPANIPLFHLFLEKDNSVSIHYRNLQLLTVEIDRRYTLI